MKKRLTRPQSARLRAQVIMKVRCGLMTASQAAEKLGVSRKTYYKWEQRGLSALLVGLEDQSPGRPCQLVDKEKQAMEKQLEKAHQENALLNHKLELKDVMMDLKLEPGLDRAKKK